MGVKENDQKVYNNLTEQVNYNKPVKDVRLFYFFGKRVDEIE
jgi:hypothetical protein